MNRLATRIRKEREERALDWIYQETLKGEEAEGHWTCNVIQTEDSDHGPCSGYEIEELGITIFTYREDPTRISIHRETKK
jgi:subtilisin-like proprotein convertase family protein